MSNFDEKSGIVLVSTPWGKWWQTMEEVFVEVFLEPASKSKDVACTIKNKSISLYVKGQLLFQGDFPKTIHADESIWTISDGRLLQIILPKSDPTAGNLWKSLLVDQYLADSWTVDQMEQKMTLNRFQLENPGFDFSGASVTGNYQGGGPQFT